MPKLWVAGLLRTILSTGYQVLPEIIVVDANSTYGSYTTEYLKKGDSYWSSKWVRAARLTIQIPSEKATRSLRLNKQSGYELNQSKMKIVAKASNREAVVNWTDAHVQIDFAKAVNNEPISIDFSHKDLNYICVQLITFSPSEECTEPEDVAGYNITGLSPMFEGDPVNSVPCADGYLGTGSAECTSGNYVLEGCSQRTTPNSQDNTSTTPRPTYATTSRISRPQDEETPTSEGTVDSPGTTPNSQDKTYATTSQTNWPLVIAVCVICSFSLIIAMYGVYFYCFGAERQTTTQNKAGNLPDDNSQGAKNAGRLENAKQFAVGKDVHKVNQKGELPKKYHKMKDAKHRRNKKNVTKLDETQLAIE